VCAIRLFYARWPSRTLWFRKVRLLNAASHPHKAIRLPGQFHFLGLHNVTPRSIVHMLRNRSVNRLAPFLYETAVAGFNLTWN